MIERTPLLALLLATCCAHVDRVPVEGPVERAQRLLDSTVRIDNGLGAGTGFMVAPGVVATAKHVADIATMYPLPLRVTTRYGVECEIQAIHRAAEHDVAFMMVTGCEHLTPIALADHDVPEGLPVMAAGHPMASNWSVEPGIIANSDVEVGDAHVLQLSVPVNSGMSGGPVVDEHGELVGLVTGIYSRDGMWAGISFAVPVDVVRDELATAMVDHILHAAGA